MKRNNPAQQATNPKIKRTIKPRQTEDGRMIGDKAKEYVPKELHNIVPKKYPRKWSKEQKDQQLRDMARTNMPLLLAEDDDILIHQKKFRMRGMTQDKFNMLLAALSVGMQKGAACKLIGISTTTIADWYKKADEGRTPYVEMTMAIDHCMLDTERKLLEAIHKAGVLPYQYQEKVTEKNTNEHGEVSTKEKVTTKVKIPSWPAAAWILERTRDSYRSDRLAEDEAIDFTGVLTAMYSVSDIPEAINNAQTDK